MNYSLVVQSTYHEIQIALFDADQLIETVSESKKTASKNILSTLSRLLDAHGCTLDAIQYIGVNQGPAPFTTLRVLITTINGIAFAKKIPLVGMNGLEAMLQENHNVEFPATLCLYNAFNNDAYFGIDTAGKLESGWENIDTLLPRVKAQFADATVRAIGSGTEFFNEKLINVFGDKLFIPAPLPEFPSVEFLHTLAKKEFENGNTAEEISPLYLKQAI
ncbi:MAG TPA: tRNA (adenosine(37)-N6)-threonylcarbamoyltransferase complex dimerization subunit type 1 TsaB [Candidatus Babeliales bacterium]|nr:tRNA (adenosine(37)-N6)-threonylcarbamoyltransferase complex dimerization subunit type 1 TsaB [Candidatus Babeliales bacterium]